MDTCINSDSLKEILLYKRKNLLKAHLRLNWIVILLLDFMVYTLSAPSKSASLKFENTESAIKYFLLEHSIIPDAVRETPQNLCKVRYTHNVYVNLGNKIDPADAQRLPRLIDWPISNNASFYTLILLDVDVPTRKFPIYKDRQHWIVTNIPRNRWKAGEKLTTYLGPIAPRNTGLHRYVFLVYKQPERIHFDEKRLTGFDKESYFMRNCYSIEKFVTKYNLGRPHAINFFLSGWPLNQDTIPSRRKNETVADANH
nr:PREDICTED: protein D3-like [Bemisia tabaci]